MRDKARNVLKQILTAASYDVHEEDDPLDLSAVGSDDALVVLCSDDAETIDEFDAVTYRLRCGDGEIICTRLLFSGVGATAENCICWDMDDLARYAGEAARAHVLGRRLDIDLTAPVPVAPEQPRAAVADDEDEALSGPEIPHLPVLVGEKRAVGIAGVHGAAKCRFIPHWEYCYTSTGERQIKDKFVSFEAEGTGILNGINGLRMEMETDRVETSAVPFGSEVLRPHIGKDEAEELLRKEVVESLTQKVRFRQEKGDAIFYEEKILKPDRNNIAVDIRLVYVPVWQVRGGSKIVEVNAFTGEVLSTPMDEGVELL